MTRKKINPKFPLLLGVIPFLIAGIDSISLGNNLLAAGNICMVCANIFGIKFVKSNNKLATGVLMILNGMMSVIISYDYYLLGKVGLPYAWLAIALFNFLVAIVFIKKHLSKELSKQEDVI